MNKIPKATITTMISILRASPNGLSYADMQLLLGVTRTTVTSWVNELRDAKLVTVVGWGIDGAGRVRTMLFGWNPNGVDATPELKPQSVRAKRWRTKQQQKGE